MPHTIDKLDAANSILFVGSGFAAGATNIAREALPAGNPLRDKLAALLGIDPREYSLRTVVDEFKERDDLDLYKVLYETFTVSAPLKIQKDILSLPWSRIYTTNYDNLIDVCKSSPGRTYPSYSYDDPKPKKLPRSFAVHLHGTIRKATPDNVLDQLVLDDTSYVKQIADRPAWMDEFERDLRFANACYFLGYSLSDHHITALLMQNETAKKKTFFIARPSVDEVFRRRVSPYGEVVAIGFDAFADLCKTLPAPAPPTDIRSLRSFKYLDPILDNRSLSSPTALEIINLVTWGTFNQARYFGSKSDDEYVAARRDHVAASLDKLRFCRTLVVHSRLGNGKTIFLAQLARSLSEEGRKCFEWRRVTAGLEQQIEVLSKAGRVVVMFDDYDAAVENVPRLADRLPEAAFVIAVRSSQQDVRFHEIIEAFPPKLERININAFAHEDRARLYEILDQAGAHVDAMKQTVMSAREVRDIVTSLYDHADIKRKIEAELKPLMEVDGLRSLIVTAHLLKWMGVEIEANFLRAVTGKDAYAELKRVGGVIGDLLSLSDDELAVRSSILSDYLILRVFDSSDLRESIHKVIVIAARRRSERRYRSLMGELMKYSTLTRVARHRPINELDLPALYEELSRDVEVNKEPLFWLQYAILMVAANQVDVAQHFLDTGYARASAMPGFRTYQLDTQALRIYLLRESASRASTVELFDKIVDALRDVIEMISDNSHRSYAIKVLEDVPQFVLSRGSYLKRGEQTELVFELNRAVKVLDVLPEDIKVQSGSDMVKHGLLSALERIVAAN